MSDAFSRGGTSPQRPTGNPLVPKRSQIFKEAHAASDTDVDRSAMHHTLGNSPNQAMPGDAGKNFYTKSEYDKEHAHDVEDLLQLPNFGTISGGLRINRTGRIIDLTYNFTCTIGFAAGTGLIQVPAIHRPKGIILARYLPFIDAGTGGTRPVYFDANGLLINAILINAGQGTLGHLTYIAKYQ